MLTGVLNETLKEYVKNTFGEYQCEFRPNGSSIDQTFVIRQMSEKFYEQDTDILMLCIDLKQVFDSTTIGEYTKLC